MVEFNEIGEKNILSDKSCVAGFDEMKFPFKMLAKIHSQIEERSSQLVRNLSSCEEKA